MAARSDDLEINQDLVFQRREWIVQRLSRWVLALFVAAASLGLFGDGVLSRARAGDSASPIRVEYERFVRAGGHSRLQVQIASDAARADGGLELRISRPYFDAVRIERISPEPDDIGIGPDDVTIRFSGPPAGEAFTVVFDVSHLEPGRHASTVNGSAGGAASFVQFAYF